MYAPVGEAGCGQPYYGDDGYWHNGGRTSANCVLWLEQQPVQQIVEVKVYGVVLDPVFYRLEANRLVRIGDWWPVVAYGCSEPTVEVTYISGIPIHGTLWGLVAIAMGEVAMEWLHGMCGGVCRLPSRLLTITRQGATVTLGEPPEDSLRLGLPAADALILATNPGGNQARAQVYSPDMPRVSTPIARAPGAMNEGGVSTVTLPTAYKGDAYTFSVTVPDASYLVGGSGTVVAQVKADPNQVSPDASFTVSGISDRTVTLTMATVTLDPGSYWLDVSIAGITFIRKAVFEVAQQVST